MTILEIVPNYQKIFVQTEYILGRLNRVQKEAECQRGSLGTVNEQIVEPNTASIWRKICHGFLGRKDDIV